jgi:hypothetical protein
MATTNWIIAKLSILNLKTKILNGLFTSAVHWKYRFRQYVSIKLINQTVYGQLPMNSRNEFLLRNNLVAVFPLPRVNKGGRLARKRADKQQTSKYVEALIKP